MALILDDIILAPFKAVHWIGKKLYEHAEEELTDESKVRQQLLELQMRFELDEITEDEYQEGEDALMARLKVIREYKEERGLD
ncbi:MAG: gas vesicle protein GvpG [Phycisphaerae bacterium]|nr:gas vesicle protein GvpG [Phycisphaerae bacterium]